MQSEAAPANKEARLPAWHSGALIALILAVALTGTVLSRLGATITPPRTAGSRVLGVYVPAIIVQWALLLYVTRIGRPKSALGALVGRRWDGVSRALIDSALGGVGALLIAVVESLWQAFSRSAAPTTASALWPMNASEHAAWVAVAVSAGFCEEVVYRGYLQTELAALTRRPTLATLLQAALFAVAHAEQGLGSVARCLIYGIGLGALARSRRSLLPGIVCHVAIDLTAGFVGH